MSFFDFLKKNVQDEPINKNVIFSNEWLIVGESYECRKDPKKSRKYVINRTTLKSPVHIEKFIYARKPAYMIVNSNLGLDIGVLSAGAADWLTSYYDKGNTVVSLTDKFQDSFHVKVVVYEK